MKHKIDDLIKWKLLGLKEEFICESFIDGTQKTDGIVFKETTVVDLHSKASE